MEAKKEEVKTTSDMKKFYSEINNLNAKSKKETIMTADGQLDRLTNQKFRNPYDVLMLSVEATEEEMRKQYRSITVLIHPDKCKDPRAQEAFSIVDHAQKTIQDADKRKIYQRIMREALERTEYERKKENKKRKKQGLTELPADTFESDQREICNKLFEEIEEKKNHQIKLQESNRQRQLEEYEEKKMKEQIKQMSEEEWEKTRDQRVKNWRVWAEKKKNNIIGSKGSDKEIRAPPVKMEARPASAPAVKTDVTAKPLGIVDDYKKSWK